MFVKILKYFFILYGIYLLAAFVLPPLLKPKLLSLLNKELQVKASLEALHFNPLLFALKAEGFQLRDQKSDKLLSFEKLILNIDPTALLQGEVLFKELRLVSPKLFIAYDAKKKLNFQTIVKEKERAQQKQHKKSFSFAELPAIVVESLKVEDGFVAYSDASRKTPFVFQLDNIGFRIEDFHTKGQGSAGKIRLYATLGDGGFFDLHTEVEQLEPLRMQGDLLFEASKLYSEWKYLRDTLELEVADGRLSLQAHYAFDQSDFNATTVRLPEVALLNLRIKPKTKEHDILRLKQLQMHDIEIFPFLQRVRVQGLDVAGVESFVQRSRSGSIDWLRYLQPQKREVSQASKKKAEKNLDPKPWDLRLETLQLKNINLALQDEAVQPAVITKLHNMEFLAKNITLSQREEIPYELSIGVNEAGHCQAEGRVYRAKRGLENRVHCRDLDIAHYQPYIDQAAAKKLDRFDLVLKKAMLNFDVALKYIQKKQQTTIALTDTNLSIEQLLLKNKSQGREILALQDFSLNGAAFSSATNQLTIDHIALQDPTLWVRREPSGALSLERLLVPKVQKKQPRRVQKSQASSPLAFHLNSFDLNNGSLEFVDAKLPKQRQQKVDAIMLHVEDIDSKKYTQLHYTTTLRINKRATLQAKGELQHTPLQQRGSFQLKNFALKVLNPYLQEQNYIAINDGLLSIKGVERYKKRSQAPDIIVRGSLDLDTLFVHDTHDNSLLFSLDELRLKPFTLELAPNRLYVEHVDVDAFYVAAQIDANKTINFAKLSKKPKEKTIQKKKEPVKKDKKEKKRSFDFKVAQVRVKNGSALFEDRSLPIAFKSNIHNLKGNLYAISSQVGDTSYISIDGDVNKYGLARLEGSVDAADPKAYMDLAMEFKNLDLHSMSGYSASFAGYEIAEGKLYLDLGYAILNGKLNATNKIVIKHIKLGRELEGEGIKYLPLGFVIGLLEDSNGIIDISLPIAGNVSDPNFKYGAIVFKTLGNLIAKAVASPFKFLASVMGIKGEDLQYIAFDPGKAIITPPQREKLDNIIKMMQKRPKIKLKVSGVYDRIADQEALKREKLIALVLQKSGDENREHSKNALNIDVLEAIYKDLYHQDVAAFREAVYAANEGKRSLMRIYQNALITKLTAKQHVEPAELEALAAARAKSVSRYLVTSGSIPINRVIWGDTIVQAGEAKEITMKMDLL